VDIVTALAQLQSFDHHACDAVIVSRQVRLEHVVLKGGSSILWGAPLLCALAVLVIWTTANVVIEYVTACRSLLAIR
jgi:hypothetical protein